MARTLDSQLLEECAQFFIENPLLLDEVVMWGAIRDRNQLYLKDFHPVKNQLESNSATKLRGPPFYIESPIDTFLFINPKEYTRIS